MSEDNMIKFKIGDAVCNKKIGLPIAGIIMGITDPILLCKVVSALKTDPTEVYKEWYNLYPKWMKTYVYTIYLEKPIKIQLNEEIKAMIDECNIPLIHSISLPEDDLELL